jgi:hypothetical protein
MNKKDLVYLIIIILILLGGFIGKNWYDNQLEKTNTAYKLEVLKSDSLTKVSETQSTKLVNDTNTIKDLREKIDSLGIKLKEKPKIVTEIVYVPKEIDKPVDDIDIVGDSLTVRDTYPDSIKPFIRYFNKISLETKKGISEWRFEPIEMSLVLSQREDGIWKYDIKAPLFINITDLEINATPLDTPDPDNFGWIIGGGLGTELLNQNGYARFEGGIRWKKLYFDIGLNTNVSADAVIKFEF